MRPGLAPALLAVSLVVAACSTVPATASPSVAPSPSSVAPPPSIAAASPPPSLAPSPPAAASGGPAAVVLDETLLGILPADVDGVAVAAEPDSFASAVADPEFDRSVEAAAFAVVVDAPDLASGVVARLRPGLYSDALFRDWRDSYDAGACAQAGGVVGNAEAELGGRTVHITRCAGGLLVYHVYLQERDVIVSLFSLGDRRFGEHLVGGLRP